MIFTTAAGIPAPANRVSIPYTASPIENCPKPVGPRTLANKTLLRNFNRYATAELIEVSTPEIAIATSGLSERYSDTIQSY